MVEAGGPSDLVVGPGAHELVAITRASATSQPPSLPSTRPNVRDAIAAKSPCPGRVKSSERLSILIRSRARFLLTTPRRSVQASWRISKLAIYQGDESSDAALRLPLIQVLGHKVIPLSVTPV